MAPGNNDSSGRDEAVDLTIDEMLKVYPEDSVHRAMFERHYADHRQATLEDFSERVSKGLMDQSYLENWAKKTPLAPPIDPAEPRDLSPDVLWRIRLLKHRLCPQVDERLRRNFDAILTAYREKKLDIDDQTSTIWYAGKMVKGPMSNKELKQRRLGPERPRLKELYGPGDLWAENTVIHRGRKLLKLTD